MTARRLLDGKRALVVGGGSGIGRAVIDAYRQEGARVAVLERSERKVEELRAELPDSPIHLGDARALTACEQAVTECEAAWGGLDVLVSCVGIFDFYRGLGEIGAVDLPGAFDEVMSVNVLGQLMPVRAALVALRESRGAVVLTGSSSSFYPGRGGILYLASKYAIRGCVAALGHELAPEVRVNGVAPGGTARTQITGPSSLGMEQRQIEQGDGRERDLRILTPLRLAMTPEDHAASYVFLASDAARGMTGTFLHPDGGMAVRD